MELHDIFSPVEIVEYSAYYFFGSIVLSFLILYTLYVFLFKNRCKKTDYLGILKKYPKDNAKYTAHLFSYYGKYITKTSHQKSTLDEINDLLKPFKYTHDHNNVPSHIQDKIHLLLGKNDA
jgi:hypothetical protein